MRVEKNCSLCNKKYKALISQNVPYVLKYMPCIFDKNKCLKHRNLQKVEKSLNICRCIRFLCIYMVYPKKNVACAKKETNHYYVHLYYRVKESFRNFAI